MVPGDGNRIGGVTNDPVQIETWARETGSIPVSENGRVQLIDKEAFDETNQSRLSWDDFLTEITESGYLVCREHDHLRVQPRDEAIAHFEGETSQHQLGCVDAIAEIDTSSSAPNSGPPVQTVSSGTARTERDRETDRRPSTDKPSLERIIPTSDDEGKTVVNPDGTKLGIVAAVDDNRIYVGSRPSLPERLLSKLGLGDAKRVSFVISSETISQISDDRIVVRTSSK